MTDFRALCEELVEALDQCQRPCGDQPESALVWKARVALDPSWRDWLIAPLDQELDELFTEIDQSGESESWRAFARTVLARWGQS
jgi:hypothetical protein